MKRKVIILGSVIAAVFVLWTAAWFVLAGMVRSNIEALAQADGESSPRVTCASLGVGGWPFRFDVTCTGAGVVSSDTALNVGEVRATVLAYQPFHVLVFAHGPADLVDAFTGSRRRLDWQMLEASVRLTDWRIARASVVIDKPVWSDTLAGETVLAQAAHAEFHLVDVPEQLDKAAHTAVLAAFATVTGLDAAGFEVSGGEGTLEADISGLPDDVRAFGDPDPLRRWHAAGGQIRIVTAKGHDADQSFDITGTLALDDAGRPDGQLNVQSKGIVEALDGIVPPDLKGLVVGSPAADGSYKQVVTLKSGIVFSGLMPAGMLPPLW